MKLFTDLKRAFAQTLRDFADFLDPEETNHVLGQTTQSLGVPREKK